MILLEDVCLEETHDTTDKECTLVSFTLKYGWNRHYHSIILSLNILNVYQVCADIILYVITGVALRGDLHQGVHLVIHQEGLFAARSNEVYQLKNEKYEDIIGWDTDNKTIAIKDCEKITEEILPVCFKQKTLKSFIRQVVRMLCSSTCIIFGR